MLLREGDPYADFHVYFVWKIGSDRNVVAFQQDKNCVIQDFTGLPVYLAFAHELGHYLLGEDFFAAQNPKDPGSVATLQVARDRRVGCSSWPLRFAVIQVAPI